MNSCNMALTLWMFNVIYKVTNNFQQDFNFWRMIMVRLKMYQKLKMEPKFNWKKNNKGLMVIWSKKWCQKWKIMNANYLKLVFCSQKEIVIWVSNEDYFVPIYTYMPLKKVKSSLWLENLSLIFILFLILIFSLTFFKFFHVISNFII